MYLVKTSMPRPYNFKTWELLLLLTVVACLLFFNGCAGKVPALQYAVGDKWGQDVARMTRLTQHAFETTTGKLVGAPGDLRVVFVPERPPCGDKNKTCHGILVRDGTGFVAILKEEPCVPRTSLAHELTHYWANQILGDLDADHKNPLLFKSTNSVVRKATAAGLFEGMCNHLNNLKNPTQKADED